MFPISISPECAILGDKKNSIIKMNSLADLKNQLKKGCFAIYSGELVSKYRELTKETNGYTSEFRQLMRWIRTNRGIRIDNYTDLNKIEQITGKELEPAKFVIISSSEAKKLNFPSDRISSLSFQSGEFVRLDALQLSKIPEQLSRNGEVQIRNVLRKDILVNLYKWPMKWAKNVHIIDGYAGEDMVRSETTAVKSGLEMFLDGVEKNNGERRLGILTIYASFNPNQNEKYVFFKSRKELNTSYQKNIFEQMKKLKKYKSVFSVINVHLIPSRRIYHDRFINFSNGTADFVFSSTKGMSAFSEVKYPKKDGLIQTLDDRKTFTDCYDECDMITLRDRRSISVRL